MSIHPMSTSYPTLAVIRAHGITDPYEVGLIWRWSGAIADVLWERTPRIVDVDLAEEIAATFAPGRFCPIRDHLHRNLTRAVAHCRAEASRG